MQLGDKRARILSIFIVINLIIFVQLISATSSINLTSPENTSTISNYNVSLNFSVSDIGNITNYTLYIWNSSASIINQTTYNNSSVSFQENYSNYSGNRIWYAPYDGNFSWNIGSCNSIGNCSANTTNFSFTIDTSSWEIIFDKDTINHTDHTNLTYVIIGVTNSAVISSYGIKNVTVFLYDHDEILINSTTFIGGFDQVNFTLPERKTYFFNATAYDNNERRKSTETRRIKSDAEEIDPVFELRQIKKADLAGAKIQKILLYEKVQFELTADGKNHTLQLNKITNNTANITIDNKSYLNFLISLGEEKKFSIGSSGKNTFYLRLEYLDQMKMNITMAEIDEKITNSVSEVIAENQVVEDAITEAKVGLDKTIFLKTSLVLFLLVILTIIFKLVSDKFWNNP